MSRCNQISIFLLYSNIIYDIIYENNLDIYEWYSQIARILDDITKDCEELLKDVEEDEIYETLKIAVSSNILVNEAIERNNKLIEEMLAKKENDEKDNEVTEEELPKEETIEDL